MKWDLRRKQKSEDKEKEAPQNVVTGERDKHTIQEPWTVEMDMERIQDWKNKLKPSQTNKEEDYD